MNLVEYAKQGTGTVIERAVISIYAQAASFLARVPIVPISGNALQYNVEEALPGIGFRGIREDYEQSNGVINQLTERLVIAGGNIDVDRFEVDTEGPATRASQTVMKTKALAHQIAFTAIKGAASVEQRSFDGLQVRLPVDGGQVRDAGFSSGGPAVGGSAISLFELDALANLVDDPTEWWMTKEDRSRLTQAARNPAIGGNIEWSKDEFGNRVASYMGLPIRILNENGISLSVMAHNEPAPNGGAAATSSIYCVSLGTSKVHMIQNAPPKVTDMGLLDDARTYRTNINWYPGLCVKHPRAVARLRGVKNTAAVV